MKNCHVKIAFLPSTLTGYYGTSNAAGFHVVVSLPPYSSYISCQAVAAKVQSFVAEVEYESCDLIGESLFENPLGLNVEIEDSSRIVFLKFHVLKYRSTSTSDEIPKSKKDTHSTSAKILRTPTTSKASQNPFDNDRQASNHSF